MRTAYITGTWKAEVTATGGTQIPLGSKWTAIIKVSQTGNTVSGTFSTVHGLSGQVTGNVLGDEVSMKIDQGPDFPGIYNGVANVNASNNEMIGTYSGSDSLGTLQASFIANRLRFYAVVAHNIKSKIYSSEEGRLWFLHFVLPGIILAIIILLAVIFSIHYIEKIVPHFSAYVILAWILIYIIYHRLKGK